MRSAEIVICGAGITGISAAYFLAKAGARDILLLDERPPLSLTSDRSTECYRNWWPDEAMVAMTNRSIDLMESLAEASGNSFHLNRRGYLYVSADNDRLPALQERCARIATLGAGSLRTHSASSSSYQPAAPDGYREGPRGADLLLGSDLVRAHFPYLSERAVAALHVRRAGWLSAQQLGMHLLEAAREQGVRFEQARVSGIDLSAGRVGGVNLEGGRSVGCSVFVNAAGPFLGEVAGMLGTSLPVHTELHQKAAIRDTRGAVPRQAPLLIWDDEQRLPWSEAERAELAADPETRWLTTPLPSGVHTRPEGAGDSQTLLMLWEFRQEVCAPVWPPHLDESYPEIVLRGLATMLPAMRAYFERMPRPQLDGGYYTKTGENRPLVGPLPLPGAYVLGAVSGYGIMSACALGELLAAQVMATPLPGYAAAFHPARYDDPHYLDQFKHQEDLGQL